MEDISAKSLLLLANRKFDTLIYCFFFSSKSSLVSIH